MNRPVMVPGHLVDDDTLSGACGAGETDHVSGPGAHDLGVGFLDSHCKDNDSSFPDSVLRIRITFKKVLQGFCCNARRFPGHIFRMAKLLMIRVYLSVHY